MSNILLIGKAEQLGWELQAALASTGSVIALDRSGTDLTDPDMIQRAIRTAKPDVIVNAAGYTAVDKAEGERDLAMQINAIAPGVTRRPQERSMPCASTIQLFSSSMEARRLPIFRPIRHGAHQRLWTKQARRGTRHNRVWGTGRYIILRATWTYSDRRTNFPLTILRLARKHLELRIVNDQTGAPTSARCYAWATAQLLGKTIGAGDLSGVYHLSASGQVTRLEWSRKIVEFARAHSGDNDWATLLPTATADYPQAAKQPLYTIMDTSKAGRLFGVEMVPWYEGFQSFLSSLSPQFYRHRALSSN